ncbi:site-specific recombinase XerD [Sphingomonas sp. PP-CE-3A-406]|uniref:tyrosine-type recombinase/integrase n=1 Tax=Sphingomonas sp. PP-CE-3A-406 TaxID=2135659 RepID=UPI000EF9C066|nr:integrase arm-type DNA-binding domain-containing protein [Sphingomonas sp. PP-CE-3A-406]RMB54753.1 site-specific recombinase XerD [Sphingomonas sp. PP-CE-3A-406]
MLTELRCRQAKAAEKSYKLSDARGLHMFVTTTGFRSWRWKYRIAGKEKLLVLGSYPDVSLALAREHRDAAARLLKAGTDPGVDRKQTAAVRHIEHATTFEAVAREWHAQQVSSWVAVHAADVLNSLEKDVFPYIGSTPVAAVTSPMVLQLVRRIEDRPSVETARRVRQRISAVYGFAIASGYATSDPAVSIRGAMKPLIKKRQPALASLEDARALLTAAEASAAHPMTKLASRLLALTALRPGTLRTTGWAELEALSEDAPVWRIPADRMKLKVARKQDERFDFLVPLSRQAMEVLQAARAFAPRGPLVFPSQRHAHKPISENAIGYFYNRLAVRARHVPHGWRSTFSTVMNERAQTLNRPGDRAIIDLMLAHIPEGVEATYNRAAYLQRRTEIAQEWADLLLDGFAPAAQLLEGPRR